MTNKALGQFMIVSLVALILTATFESMLTIETANSLYGFAAIGLYVFGIWGAARLIKSTK